MNPPTYSTDHIIYERDRSAKKCQQDKATPRPEFIGKYDHKEIWWFAQELATDVLKSPSTPCGFSVASAMLEQLLAERQQSLPGKSSSSEKPLTKSLICPFCGAAIQQIGPEKYRIRHKIDCIDSTRRFLLEPEYLAWTTRHKETTGEGK